MPRYKLAFLVQPARELAPQLDFRGFALAKMEAASDNARAQLADQLDSVEPESLEVNGFIPVVLVEVEAGDEERALLAGFHQAALAVAPYSLIVPVQEMIDFSRKRPVVIPHALLIDDAADPPTVAFRYQEGPRLLRLNVGGESVARVQNFNNDVVRRIAELYPQSLLRAGDERSPLALRIARAVHWYSQAEGSWIRPWRSSATGSA